ncbi:MAG TPA: hypothetical protein VFU81_04295 [Thermomicrobiales bacterium]|nr:hypothetical protein [Thermomicrobiales bacterium]
MTAAAIAAVAATLFAWFNHLIDGRAGSFAELLGAALGTGAAIFVLWPAIDRRWTNRDRHDDPKRFVLVVAGLAVGIGVSLLPWLTGTGTAGDFAQFVVQVVAFVTAVTFAFTRRPPVG